MKELIERLPDPEALLVLEVEELAEQLLFALKDQEEKEGKKKFSALSIGSSIISGGDRSIGMPSYPEAQRADIAEATVEAFHWLSNNGFLVAEYSQTYENQKILTRRAYSTKSAKDFCDVLLRNVLRRDSLHPTIAEQCWLHFIRGEYAQAIFYSMRQVEIEVRSASSSGTQDVGVKLIRKAFDKDAGPLSDKSSDVSERESLAHLFAGAIGTFKNSHSHRDVDIDDPKIASEIVHLASHLLRIVDSRRIFVASSTGTTP